MALTCPRPRQVFFNLSGFVLLLATGASAALFGEKQSDGWG